MSIKISNLPPAVSVNDADLVPIVQDGVTKKAATILIRPAFGDAAGTVCQGNDSRLSNSRIPTGAAGGDLIESYPNPTLTTTGVVALTYGSAANIGVFSVDNKGRITGATSQAIAISPTQISTGITSAQISGISAAQVASGITSAQISGISAAQVASGITSAQISGISAAQVASGITSAQLSAITGTGSVVLTSSPAIAIPTINGYTEGTVVIGTVGTTHTLAITAGTVLTATLTASTACVFTMPPLAAGKSFVLYLKQPPTGTAGTASFVSGGSGVAWPNGIAPTITATAGRMDILSFVSDGFKWYGSVVQNFIY
jgi:hypothetical protein